LKRVDLTGQLILGEAGLTRSLLSVFPEAIRPKVRHAIAHLDRLALEALPLSDAERDRALLLLDLRGKPADVLQKVSALDLNETERESVNNLKSLIELLQASVDVRIVLDLSLIRTFDYYTGIVFEVVTQSGQIVLGQGGRYDRLLGQFHPQGESIPGIGFSLQLENLHQVLLTTGQLPKQTQACDWLVVSEVPQLAFAHARKLREKGDRVEVDLSCGTVEEIRQYAEQRRISQIAWVKADGKIVVDR